MAQKEQITWAAMNLSSIPQIKIDIKGANNESAGSAKRLSLPPIALGKLANYSSNDEQKSSDRNRIFSAKPVVINNSPNSPTIQPASPTGAPVRKISVGANANNNGSAPPPAASSGQSANFSSALAGNGLASFKSSGGGLISIKKKK